MLSKVLLAFLGFSRAVVGEDLQTCGVTQYYPSQYTCFDNDFLCPKGPSGTYLRCNDACYLPSQYSYVSIIALTLERIFVWLTTSFVRCSDNQLIQLNPNLPEELLQCGSAQFYASQVRTSPKTYKVILTSSTVCLLRQ